MRDFNQRRDNRGGFKSEGRGFGRQNFGSNDRRDRGPITMHQAICAECGKSCEVPFRPSGEKPVYCSNCFENRREGADQAPRKDFGRQNFAKDGFDKNRDQRGNNEEIKRLLETIINRLDQLIRSIDRLAGSGAENKTDSKAEDKLISIDKKVIAKQSAVPKKQVAVKKTKKINKTS
jgi:CxxC-x17-CxxC domain-containing protein